MNTLRRNVMLVGVTCAFIGASAQGPNNTETYYQAADGLQSSELKTALCGIIYEHTVREYSDLWEDFKSTDCRDDGKVWDMYSGSTNYTFGDDQGKNYTAEGDTYNREHSFPKSWFGGEVEPMYTDLMHLVPTDGYVNAKRSNYPFGETDSPTYTSDGEFSKLGPSSVSGYTGTVFEPNDEYKGDFARIYFYMATCYENEIEGWSCDMLSGDSYPALTTWAIKMLLQWAYDDPVSEKELNRNEAVYTIQGNRNPFVDYPGLEQYVWGPKQDVVFSYDNYDSTLIDPSTYFDSDDDSDDTEDDDDTDTDEDSGETYSFVKVVEQSGLVTDGYTYLIVYEGDGSNAYAMAASDSDVRSYSEVTISNSTIETEVDGSGQPRQLVLGGEEDAYTFYDETEGVYLALTSNKNKLQYTDDDTTDNAKWTIAIDGGDTDIFNNAYTSREIQYNTSSPRFACYTSTQQPVVLYRRAVDTSISDVTSTTISDKVRVYSITGTLVRDGVTRADALTGLNKGIYIVDNRKFVVK